MKKITWIVAISFSNLVVAQTSVYTENYAVENLSNQELNDPSPSQGNRIGIGNPSEIHFTTNEQKDVSACTEIHLTANTHLYAPSTSTNNLHLFIAGGGLDIVSYTHQDLTQVHALEKFETGVVIPDEIMQRIQAFKTNDQDTNGLNPFLEWEVALKVTYTHVGSGYTHFNYGFYYEDYTRYTPGYPYGNHENWGWKMVANTEEFRVRYAFPEKTGDWVLQYELYVDGELYHSYCPFNVTVTGKNSGDGYVRVADNKRVLERDGDLFLPIGENMAWPDSYRKRDNSTADPFDSTTVSCEYDVSGKPCESAAFLAFDEKLQNFANSDVNYFRFHLSPGSIDLEFEKLGNYFNRLNYATEIDKIITFAEQQDMYVDFNMKVHYNLVNGPIYGLFAWDGSDYTSPGFDTAYGLQEYCYVKELGMQNPVEFLTNEEAKKYYKQKLRYLLSRWGYSTHIAMFELVSEINEIGDSVITQYNFPPDTVILDTNTWYKYATDVIVTHPYNDNAQVRQNVYHWHQEMAEYIKNDLQHTNQLLTCSYAGPPDFDGFNNVFSNPQYNGSDKTYGIPELDLMSVNYSFNGDLNRVKTWQNMINYLHDTYDKPIIFSETGAIEELGCSGTYAYTQELWMCMFTGLAGFNYWDAQYVKYAPQWAEMKRMKDWILNDPLKKDIMLGNWKTGHANGTVRGTEQYHPYWRKEFNYIYLSDQNQPIAKAFGAMINLTDNYYTNNVFPDSTTWCTDTIGNNNLWFSDRFSIEMLPSSNTPIEQRLFIKNDLSFLDDPIFDPWENTPSFHSETVWYDFTTLDSIPGYAITDHNTYNNNPFRHPPLYVTMDSVSTYGFRDIIPFTSTITGEPNINNGIAQTSDQHQSCPYAIVAQNDALNFIAVQSQQAERTPPNTPVENSNKYSIYITNTIGQQVYSGTMDMRNPNSISTSGFPTGLMIVTLVNNQNKYTLRWLNL